MSSLLDNVLNGVRSTPTYCLLSTTNARVHGWKVYYVGSKSQCEDFLDTSPIFRGTDIYADTLRKNAVIVSKTKALREFGIYPEEI